MTSKRTLLGILTPSSNTVLEPLTSAMLNELEDVSAHFGRFGVTEISMGQASQAQFQLQPQLDAAALLADAHVGAIIWSGTSASWLGFEQDRTLCEKIHAHTGVVAGSSVLAINELFAIQNVRRFGLVTPYIDEIQTRIVSNYRAHGFDCVAEQHLNETRNFEFANFSEEKIAEMIRAVAQEKPDAITVMCTNMRGARIAQALEQETGIPIFDSTSAALWAGMRLSGADSRRVQGWGSLFSIA